MHEQAKKAVQDWVRRLFVLFEVGVGEGLKFTNDIICDKIKLPYR